MAAEKSFRFVLLVTDDASGGGGGGIGAGVGGGLVVVVVAVALKQNHLQCRTNIVTLDTYLQLAGLCNKHTHTQTKERKKQEPNRAKILHKRLRAVCPPRTAAATAAPPTTTTTITTTTTTPRSAVP